MKNKIFNSVLVILCVLVVSGWSVYFASQGWLSRAETETEAVAEQTAKVMSIDKFYAFNKNKTIYSIIGTTASGDKIYFAYDPETKNTYTGVASELVDERNALAITRNDLPNVVVKEARLGIDNDIFVWEVSFIDENGNLGYHYINATNGLWYETLNNL